MWRQIRKGKQMKKFLKNSKNFKNLKKTKIMVSLKPGHELMWTWNTQIPLKNKLKSGSFKCTQCTSQGSDYN